MIDWNPQIIQPKDGGVFQDSPIAQGRRLVYAIDATAIENFELAVNDYDQDGLIKQAQDLMRLLLKARAYQSTEFQSDPVWIRARAACETEDRFALIINWSIPELDNPYAQPFFTANQIAAMEDINLQLERGHWRKLQPGTGECAEAESGQDWNYNFTISQRTTTPTAYVSGLARHPSSGAYYAVVAERRIMKSVDAGVTWANNLTGAPIGADDDLYGITALANGNLLAFGRFVTGASMFLSTNDGTSWSAITLTNVDTIYDVIQIGNGSVIAVGLDTGPNSGVWYSTDNGATFTKATVTDPYVQTLAAVVQVGNRLIASGAGQYFFVSTDNGLTWARYTPTSGLIGGVRYDVIKMIMATDGYIYAIARSSITNFSVIYKSIDGQTWEVIYFKRIAIVNLIEGSDGFFYASFLEAGASGNQFIYRSPDFGETWQLLSTLSVITYNLGTYNRYGLLEYPSLLLFGLGNTTTNGYIYRTLLNTSEVGRASPTCENGVYVANRGSEGNLTHIFIDDGGVFSSIYPIAVFPQTLFPAAIAVNDALYFGSQTTVFNGGVFGGLVFNIETPMLVGFGESFTLVWEYWSGAGWSTLTTNDTTLSFQNPGFGSVVWQQPTNWTTNSVNGVTAYWVRAKISAVSGTITPPTQQDDQIYTPTWGWVETDDVAGDIPAIMRILAYNQSDIDGRGGSADLFDNRVLVGLRSLDRGENFRAYLNLTDNGIQPGVSLSLGTNTTYAADVSSPTGRRAVYNPAGVEAMAQRVGITLEPALVKEYYGIFHAFLRGRRTAGAATDLSIRLQISTGTGGIIFTSQSKQFQTTTIFEVLDFGEITLPISGSFNSDDIADSTLISIQASAASGTPDLYLYDLILIPVDEWAVDAVDFTNSNASIVGMASVNVSRLLDIDSVISPKNDIRTLVRYGNGTGFVSSEYNPITNGLAILQANTTQRLWFFAMLTSATGTSYSWLAPPEIIHSIQLYKNEGYLGLVGVGQ